MEYRNKLEASGFESCRFSVWERLYRSTNNFLKVGLPYVEHDKRYDNADEYLRILYKYVASRAFESPCF